MKRQRWRRTAASAALLAVLAASGYMGAMQSESVQMVSVPIVFEPLDEGAIAAASKADAGSRLDRQREQALALLEEVLSDSKASPKAIESAHEQKTRMAADMEREARLEAALELLGIGGAKAVSGERAMTVFVPPDAAVDDKVRVQIVDAAASVTGLSAEYIKIILAKNE